MFMIFTLIFTGAAALIGLFAPGQSPRVEARNIVPVRGGYIEASGWEGVPDLIRKEGFNLCGVQDKSAASEPKDTAGKIG